MIINNYFLQNYIGREIKSDKKGAVRINLQHPDLLKIKPQEVLLQ